MSLPTLSRSVDPHTIRFLKCHRLLFLQHTSIFEGYGGVEYYLDDLAGLACESFGRENVAIIAPQRKSLRTPLVRAYPVYFVPFSNNPIIRRIENRFSLRYLRKAREIVSEFRPNLLLCSHVSLGPLTHALHRLTHVPYGTCVYGIESWGNLWPQDEWCLRRSNFIFSISHWTKKILVDRGYPSDRIHIVAPTLGTAFESMEFVPPTPQETFTLLTVSRLDDREQYKGNDHVLYSLAKLRPQWKKLKLRYIIQGNGNDRERLEKIVRDLDLASIVEFRGEVTDRGELLQVYRQADLFVMPSRFGHWGGRWRGEGFGIVYLEAAAFGVPSIAYRCGGATDIIEHGVDGWLIEPDNIDSLASTIEGLAKDRNRVKQFGLKAREKVMKKFTRHASRTQLTEALDLASAQK